MKRIQPEPSKYPHYTKGYSGEMIQIYQPNSRPRGARRGCSYCLKYQLTVQKVHKNCFWCDQERNY